eukprot:2945119-Pyramimonas_sp.AAC.1
MLHRRKVRMTPLLRSKSHVTMLQCCSESQLEGPGEHSLPADRGGKMKARANRDTDVGHAA